MPEIELAALARGRDLFHASIDELLPVLHRYCARMMGSAVDGEDVVQEALAKAYYHLSRSQTVPPLRPWLLRIAHTTALDHLGRYERRYVAPVDSPEDLAGEVERSDPAAVRAALATFLELPPLQRSAVILKDVLGLGLEDIASTLGTTVPAVKAALVRGRRGLEEARARPAEDAPTVDGELRRILERYAALFNARDWDGLRALLSREVELDLVSRASRRGAEVGQYFGNYARLDVQVAAGLVDGRPGLAVTLPGSDRPAYAILLAVGPDGVRHITDYRYVPYLGEQLSFRPLP